MNVGQTSGLTVHGVSDSVALATIVEVGPSDYGELKPPSNVDSNVVFRKALSELAEKIQRKEVGYKEDQPPVVLNRICQAIKASPLVEEETKQLLDKR